MMAIYEIPFIPPSLNKFAGRKNEWEYRNLKNEWKNIIAIYCRPKVCFQKCIITLEYYFKTNARHDPDNYSGKMVLDGLTAAGIIQDDDFAHIELIIKQGGVDKKGKLIISIKEA